MMMVRSVGEQCAGGNEWRRMRRVLIIDRGEKEWKGEIQCELFAFGGILYDRINSK